jgi:hypothetical protein
MSFDIGHIIVLLLLLRLARLFNSRAGLKLLLLQNLLPLLLVLLQHSYVPVACYK